MNEAFRDWVTTVGYTHYCIGSVGGPHPFPMMVRDFQRIIGLEAREQVLGKGGCPTWSSPASAAAPTRSASSTRSSRTRRSRLIGCEAGGDGAGHQPARRDLHRRLAGVLHGMRTYVLQDDEGQTRRPTRSRPAWITRASAPNTSG